MCLCWDSASAKTDGGRLCVSQHALEGFSLDDRIKKLQILASKLLLSYEYSPRLLELSKANETVCFHVLIENKKAVLRITPSHVASLESITSEMKWLDILVDCGFHVPKPIRTLDGDLTAVLYSPEEQQTYTCVLLSALDGQPVDRSATLSQIEYVGRALAILHGAGDKSIHTVSNDRVSLDYMSVFGPKTIFSRLHIFENELSTDGIEIIDLAIEKLSIRMLTEQKEDNYWGLLHGNLERSSVSFRDEEIHFANFCRFGPGPLLLDIVSFWTSYEHLLRSASKRSTHPSLYDLERVRDRFLAGYDEVRRLPLDLSGAMKDYKALRLLLLLGRNLEMRLNIGRSYRDTAGMVEELQYYTLLKSQASDKWAFNDFYWS